MRKLQKESYGYSVREGARELARLVKEPKGYAKYIPCNNGTTWINPPVFGFFYTLKDAKHYYEIK